MNLKTMQFNILKTELLTSSVFAIRSFEYTWLLIISEAGKKFIGFCVVDPTGTASNDPLSRRIKRKVTISPELNAFCVISVTLEQQGKQIL